MAAASHGQTRSTRPSGRVRIETPSPPPPDRGCRCSTRPSGRVSLFSKSQDCGQVVGEPSTRPPWAGSDSGKEGRYRSKSGKVPTRRSFPVARRSPGTLDSRRTRPRTCETAVYFRDDCSSTSMLAPITRRFPPSTLGALVASAPAVLRSFDPVEGGAAVSFSAKGLKGVDPRSASGGH